MVELYGKTYPGTTSTSMRYHLGSVGAVDGANRENPDAHKEDPEGPPCQDLCHALCIRLKVSLVFILLFSILLSFLTTPPLTHSTQWLHCQKPIFRPTLLKSHLKRKIHQKSKNYIFNRFHTKSAVSFKCGKSRVEFQVKLAFAVSHLIITQKPGVSLSRWKTHCMGQLLHKQGKGSRHRPIRLNFCPNM